MYHRICGIAALSALLLATAASHAQDKSILSDPALMKEMLQQPSLKIDPSAQAVVLYEKGEYLVMDNTPTYKIERIVKIIGTEGVAAFAAIDVSTSRTSIIRKVKGETFNLDQDNVTKQTIEKTDILIDKTTEYTSVTKFNLPAVKPGSVIHYTFLVENPPFYFAPDWYFQQKFPVLYSEYETRLPKVIDITPIANTAIPFKQVSKQQNLQDCDACTYTESYGGYGTVTSIWVRRNVPAFKKEPFMSSSKNYLERIKLHVTSISSGSYFQNVYNNWNDVTKNIYYKNDKFCGQVFNPNNFLNEKVEQLTTGKATKMDKAKAIFSYVRDSIKLKKESYNDYSALSDIKDVYRRKEGNSNGINLLLTAMLRTADMDSEPVILSTRTEEHLNPLLPNPSAIDYVVSIVNVDGKDYFLDASDKYAAFGVLPAECYNGYCRIVSKTPAAAELHPDNLKDKNLTMVSLTPDDKRNDKLVLKVDQKFGDISAALLRNSYKGDSLKLKEKILKNLSKLSIPATLTKYSFSSLNNADEAFTVHYEALVNWDNATDMVYIDPYFEKLYDKNPFSATSRYYPVEMDHLSDNKYVFHFKLPSNYIVDDFPKSTVIKLGSEELMQLKNALTYDEADKAFDIDCRYSSKTTVYTAEGYNQLRNFYDNVIAEQQKKIVLKKVN